jgi:hypothetical protein
VSADVLLPAPLKLRKESARLAETVHTLRSEQEVRDAVAELNRLIKEWRLIPVGPPIFVPLVDEEAMVAAWREAHRPPPPASAALRPAGSTQATSPAGGRSRFWHRRRPRSGS